MNSMDEWKFSITPYKGFEKDVLRLRNDNRERPASRSLLDWRYEARESSRPSLIFWVHDKQGGRVGMAGVAFRPYWVNRQLYHFAVTGDISLNKAFRGKGLARKLFYFMNEYMDKNGLSPAFVIPNPAAQRSLSSAGWKRQQPMINHVFYINPGEKASQLLKSKAISFCLATIYKRLVSLWLKMIPSKGISLEHADPDDPQIEMFWRDFQRENLIIRDRSPVIMKWRYGIHPSNNFTVIKFLKQSVCVGFLTYLENKAIKAISIYDFIMSRKNLVQPAMGLFIRQVGLNKDINSIRITQNSNHSYSGILSRTGFVRRNSDSVIQTYGMSKTDEYANSVWFINSSDKDT